MDEKIVYINNYKKLSLSMPIKIQEIRSNPQLNQKLPLLDILKKYYNDAPGIVGIGRNAFASFTEKDKLGINPQSVYDTPLGIYAYPLNYVLDTIKQRSGTFSLPYGGNHPYINLFGVKGNVIDISKMNKTDVEKYQNIIVQKYRNISKEIMDQVIEDAYDYSRIPSKGGGFWYVTLRISSMLSSGNYFGIDESRKNAIMWNKLFRDIGIDVVVDNGSSVIHENEPTQAVVFNPRSIINLKRIHNVRDPEKIQHGEYRREEYLEWKISSPEERLKYIIYNSSLYGRFVKSFPLETYYDPFVRVVGNLMYEKYHNIIVDDIKKATVKFFPFRDFLQSFDKYQITSIVKMFPPILSVFFYIKSPVLNLDFLKSLYTKKDPSRKGKDINSIIEQELLKSGIKDYKNFLNI